MNMFMEEIWMINPEEFKEKVLDLEKESLANITKPDDNQIVAKIMKMYEKECYPDDNQ